ncbi:HK97 family phage prohead protease [Mycoplasma sp. VS31B]
MENKVIYMNSPLAEVISRNVENTQDNKQERTIELTIELDSWSPEYPLGNDGKKYREKLDLNCFDFEKPVEQLELNSYLDHKIGIEHLIASTKDGTMSVQKEGSKIIARLKVNEADPLSKKTADLIQKGVITSNSFIFKPEERDFKWYKEEETENGVTLEVIHKKAKLISIDPVFAGFYPQDKCRAYDENNKFLGKEYMAEINQEQQTQEERVLETQSQPEPQEAVEKRAEKDKEFDIKLPDEINSKIAEVVSEMKEIVSKINEKANTLLNESQEEKTEENSVTRAILNTIQKGEKNVDIKEIKTKIKTRQKLSAEELDAFYLANAKINEEVKREVGLIAPNSNEILENLTARALDGTTNLKGLAVVETLTEPGILTEASAVFPELTEFARRVPLTGLDKLSTRVLVGDKKLPGVIAEAEESTDMSGSTFAVTLLPDRRSVKIQQNSSLTLKEQLLSAQVQNVSNQILEAVRKDLYTDIFKNAGKVFNAEDYTGGATSEAKRLTNETNKITFADVDRVATEIRAQYGDNALSNYFIVLHPDVYAELKRSLINDTQSALIKDLYDIKNDTFKGAKIIVTDKYPEKEWSKGKKPVLFLPKDQVLVYGLAIVAQDDPYTGLSRGVHYTIVSTRGQVKLVDPFIYTRFIEVK